MVSWLTVWMLPYLSLTSTLQKSTILIFVQMKALTQYNTMQYNTIISIIKVQLLEFRELMLSLRGKRHWSLKTTNG